MGYNEFLYESAQNSKSVVCFGIDPVLEEMPHSDLPTEEKIVSYFTQIADAALPSISAIKPNYAFFAQYGFDGLRALKKIIDSYKGKLPVILDAKRGDIGKSSIAYAKEAFDFFGADAVTVSPYMGYDSILPFLEKCRQGKGVYVLCKTTNKGSSDFQMKATEDKKPLFLEVAKKMEKWHVSGMGAVVGAIEPEDIEMVMWHFYDSKKEIPLLIPGIGAQGGSAEKVAATLRTVWKEIFPLHRINSSSAIAYAYKKKETDDFVGAALEEIKRMNGEIGKF